MKNRLFLVILMTISLMGINSHYTLLSAQVQVDYSFSGVCAGSPTIFIMDTNITDVKAIAIRNWDFGDGAYATIQDPNHTYTAIGKYPVTLTVTDTNGVIGVVTHFVEIISLPVPLFTYDTPNCANDSVQFTDLSYYTSGYIDQWIWNFGDGSPADTVNFPYDPNVKHLYALTNTYNVTLRIRSSYNCYSSVVLPVTVTPAPIANFYFSGNCEDQVVQFNDASSQNGSGNIVDWEWDFGDPGSGTDNTSILSDPVHTFATPGTFSVRLIVTNFTNCRDTMVKQVIIRQSPPVDFIITSGCLNELTYFNPDASLMNLGSIGTWLWDFGDGNTSNIRNASHIYSSPGTYTVTLIVTDISGCMNSITHDIIINPLPVAHFSVSVNTCKGIPVKFTNHSTITTGYIQKWFWQFGDGTDSTVLFPANPGVEHVYATAGIYSVSLVITTSDNCISTEIQNIIVHPNPLANFDFGLSCFGMPVTFHDLSQQNGGGVITDRNWNFGDPASGVNNTSFNQTPEHLFTIAGIYNIRLIITTGNGCSDTLVRILTVLPAPPVEFTAQNRCLNEPVSFLPDLTVVNPGAIGSWFWDFGDGTTSNQQQPLKAFNLPGYYIVSLTVTDTSGCSNTAAHEVSIVPMPVADFDITSPICSQAPAEFSNLSFTLSGYIVKWDWDFGDGTISTINFPFNPGISHIYTNYGSFNVTLTVTTNEGCIAFITKTVNVLVKPLANFTHQTACLNTPAGFTDLSQSGGGGSIIGWFWDFNDPTSGVDNFATLKNPFHSFSNPGTYLVSLIVTSSTGCSDTVSYPVTINPAPAVDFTSVAGCENDTTQFTCSTFVNAGTTTNYLWQFGDGSTSSAVDPVHLYTQSGSYSVTLTITNNAGCKSFKTHFVNVVPLPIAFFAVESPACSNYPVQFNNMSTTTSGIISSWYWEFDDGSDSLVTSPGNPNISHIYSAFGTFNVKLTVTTSAGCENSVMIPVSITTGPLADFSFATSCLSEPVSFADATTVNGGTNIVSWLWNFGDPASGINNTSGLKNPLHVFSYAGTFIVNLQVINANGCMGTSVKTITLNPLPGVDFSYSTPDCLGAATGFIVDRTITNTGDIQVFDWDFGDGTPHSNAIDPVHIYASSGIFNVILSITNNSGCKNSSVHPIEIHALPTPLFSYNTACAGDLTHFKDESFNINGELIVNWHWEFGDPASTKDTSSLKNPTWSYASSGLYNVTLTITTAAGCLATISLPVQVYLPPDANFNYTAALCEHGVIYFQDSSMAHQTKIVQWYWEFSPNNFSNLQNPVYVFFDTDSCYNVKLIVTDIHGCMDTIIRQVCVPADLQVAVNYTETCYMQTTDFSVELVAANASSISDISWNFGEPSSGAGNTSTLLAPSHTYSTPGNYTVTLVAKIQNCYRTVYRQVTIHALPVPVFSYTENNCDSIAFLHATSGGGGAGIKQWIWNYGDGITETINAPDSPDLPHFYALPGMYLVSLTVINTNDCSVTFSDSLLMKPCLEALFTINDSLGCQNQAITFVENSYSGVPLTKWKWDFGDGNTLSYNVFRSSVTHIFNTSGVFNVKLVISSLVSGGTASDSLLMDILINPSPIALFNAVDACLGVPTKFINTSSGNGSQVSSYDWDFGVPRTMIHSSSLKDPDYLYNTAATYNVNLIVYNTIGCSDTVTQPLTVHPLPSANFNYSASCTGDPTLFFDLSDSAYVPLKSWKWMFEDTSGVLGTDLSRNSSFAFPHTGKYNIQLSVTDNNGCIDTITRDIITNPIPTSDFTYTEKQDNLQGQLIFNNVSAGAEAYHWDFGNGTTSTAENPKVTYDEDGTYPIELISWNAFNCSDTLKIDYELLFKGLYIPNAFSPGNPIGSVRLFKPVGINLASYKIEVFDSWGNKLWQSTEIDAQGRPTEGWDGTVDGVAKPQDVYIWKAKAVFKDGTIWKFEDLNDDGIPDKPYGTVTLIR